MKRSNSINYYVYYSARDAMYGSVHRRVIDLAYYAVGNPAWSTVCRINNASNDASINAHVIMHRFFDNYVY